MDKIIGIKPNQAPSNADLGTIAYQDAEYLSVENLKVGSGSLGTTPSAWVTIVKDNENSGNQLVLADTEGQSPAIRTYSIPGTGGDPAGLILNHYYAQSGGGNQYMRYADIVANVGSGAGTTMRFITKNSSNTFSNGLKIDQDGKVFMGSSHPAGNFGVYIQGKGAGVNDARALHVKGFGNHTTIGATGPTLVLAQGDGTTNNITKLSFETSSNGEAVSINCINTNHSSFYGDMAFNTRGAVSGYSEKLRIKADGNVGIGWNDPYTKLHVNGPIQDIEHAVSNNSANQWSKIGTIYGLPQGGANIHLHFKMHSGYNAQNYQDYTVDLFMKTSNGSSTNPSGGSLINSWWYKLGNSGAEPRFKWKEIATNDYELFMYVPAYASNSSYTVKKSAGQWANSGAVLQSDPGSDSSTVLEAEERLGFYTEAVFNGGLKVVNSNLTTLQGSFYNNGVREYSQYIDNLHNGTSVNFDVPVTRTGSGYTVYYECMYNHFGNQTYGSWRSGFFSFRSDNNNTYFDDPIHNGSSAGGGAWTASLINANTATPYIRFNKSAGSYVGTGDGHIFVRGGAL